MVVENKYTCKWKITINTTNTRLLDFSFRGFKDV